MSKLRQIYKKGAKYEYRIKHKLEENGWFVVRSGGSHGIVDLIAIHPHLHEIKVIQCKTNLANMSDNQKKSILEPLKALEGEYMVRAELL